MNKVRKKQIFLILVTINLVLVCAHILSNHLLDIPFKVIINWFNLDREANIPTWFSSIQLFIIGTLSFFYSTKIENKELKKFYFVTALLFFFISLDETAQIHEGITAIFLQLSIKTIFPDSHGMWIFIYPVILIIISLLFRKSLYFFLKEKPGRTIFILGIVVFISGSVLFEISGYYFESGSYYYKIEVIAEESAELLGQSILILSLLLKLFPDQSGSNEN